MTNIATVHSPLANSLKLGLSLELFIPEVITPLEWKPMGGDS